MSRRFNSGNKVATLTSSLTEGFRVWANSVKIPTLKSLFVSTLGAAVIMAALNFAHRTFANNSEPSWLDTVLGNTPQLPVFSLVAIVGMLLVASLVHSGVSQIDSKIIRKYINRVFTERSSIDENLAHRVVSERFLLEAWSGLLGAIVQVTIFTFAILYFGGIAVFLGTCLGLGIVALSGLSFFRRAVKVSIEFMASQKEAVAAEKQTKTNKDSVQLLSAKQDSYARVREAIYQRDTTVLRMPFTQNLAISAGAMFVILLPAVLTLNLASHFSRFS